MHEQTCPTSRCGLRRLGSDPGVEYIYIAVDVAAVQLNVYPWTHGTSGSESVVAAFAERIQIAQFQSYGKLTNRRTDDGIRVVLVWQSRVVPGRRKG